VDTNMTRTYGRGLEGELVIGRVPFAALLDVNSKRKGSGDGPTAAKSVRL